jgi:hypothetical protein
MIEPTAEKRDMDALLDQLLAFARQMLRRQGSVFPFGAVTKADGRMSLVAGSGGRDGASNDELMGLVVSGMREHAAAGEIRAAGLCYEVHVPTDDGSVTDAIAVSLESVIGETALVFMPFTRSRLSGVRFDEITVMPGEARIFAPA